MILCFLNFLTIEFTNFTFDFHFIIEITMIWRMQMISYSMLENDTWD